VVAQHAPELYAIERCWRDLLRHHLANRCFAPVQHPGGEGQVQGLGIGQRRGDHLRRLLGRAGRRATGARLVLQPGQARLPNRWSRSRTLPAVRRSSAAIAGTIWPWLACQTVRARSPCRAGAVRAWASFSLAIRSASVT
jgi:hypothetical protein